MYDMNLYKSEFPRVPYMINWNNKASISFVFAKDSAELQMNIVIIIYIKVFPVYTEPDCIHVSYFWPLKCVWIVFVWNANAQRFIN